MRKNFKVDSLFQLGIPLNSSFKYPSESLSTDYIIGIGMCAPSIASARSRSRSRLVRSSIVSDLH